MAVIQALKRTPGTLVGHPIVFGLVLLYGILTTLLQIPQLVYQQNTMVVMGMQLVTMGVTIFVYPFFWGGLMGIANDAASGHTPSFGRFLSHGRSFYLSILGAYLLVTGVFIVFAFAAVAALFAGGIGFVLTDGSAVGIAIFALLGLLLAVVYLVVAIAIQFFPHAIVIEGNGAIDSVRRSLEFVRSNLLAVAGHVLVGFTGGVLAAVPLVAVQFVLFPPAMPGESVSLPDPGLAVGAFGVSALVTAIVTSFLLVFTVRFYRAVIGLEGAGARGSAPAQDW